MIESKEVATKISELMLNIGKELNESVFLVQEQCSESEFFIYRRQVGIIMGNILLDVLNPLYEKHADLKPRELK
ncbi:hypothetical protein [Flavobacterium johnsoniae]|uniref:Uncharacterized protein n=1 Tax=Flavobacterium johnsoniae (strain ATCC 17061 / DSM 2064 / JCM 8514 / BCRC 14874 / CCUG 350202 / NBRC 14942 / NCIMB 11054 / UW101) TaxID=376686 RepID=A5FAM3_FLAJ1|nr:hypothetical protein [Flavobacterium johnsoniae]ABQ07743.1 hypothetical protein Fjoh_4744 [Flavobacterium johnsoniae UW101]OXG01827.1 hypothetical protein B0A63_03980 [Flavobacterium johnsoniae UW101]WQG80416.1 hypothetical protein SR927_20635 [Flavobacterium johnsoniae UW101]SHL03447.1 hypothetical protein SAMN05444146_2733 [Flavobacterium johnsoniae]